MLQTRFYYDTNKHRAEIFVSKAALNAKAEQFERRSAEAPNERDKQYCNTANSKHRKAKQ